MKTITKKQLNEYITKNDLAGDKIEDVLTDYVAGYTDLGDICFFHDYNIDMAMSHILRLQDY